MLLSRSRLTLAITLSCGLWAGCNPGSGGGGAGGLGADASGGTTSTGASGGTGGTGASGGGTSGSGGSVACSCPPPNIESSPSCYSAKCVSDAPPLCSYTYYPPGTPCGFHQACSSTGHCNLPTDCLHTSECDSGGCCCADSPAHTGTCIASAFCTAPSVCLP